MFKQLQADRAALSVKLRDKEAQLAKLLWQSRPSKTMAPGDNDRNIEMYGRTAELQAEVDKLRDEAGRMDDWAQFYIKWGDR